jgi:two-component sensor histidine kinase
MGRLAAIRRNPWAGFAIGGVLFTIAFAVRYALQDELAPFPFLVFFPPIVVTAIVGGVMPSVMVTALATLGAWAFLPAQDSGDDNLTDVLGVAFFWLVAAVDIALIEMLYRMLAQFEVERQRVTGLLKSRETLFQELQHRVANNMQFISSLLAVQRKQIGDDPAARTLEEASGRLRAMARIHRRLYDPANADRGLGPLIEELCHELLDATGAKNIVCLVDIPDIRLPLDRIVALAMLTSEALTNAVKHAFADGRPGTIRVSLERLRDELAFVISDDGQGMDRDAIAANSVGLGMRIIQSLAQQLHAELTYGPAAKGSELRLQFRGPSTA